MQLSPGTRSILAYFPSTDKAAKAKELLENEGIKEIQLDRVSRYGYNPNKEINNPIQGRADTLTGLTLYSANTDQYSNNDARILLSADPSVNGMADGGYGTAEGKSFLLTVVTDEEKLDKAVEILKNEGAYF